MGTWIADTDTADPAYGLEIFIFTADGGFIEGDPEDLTLGAWEATGASSAAYDRLVLGDAGRNARGWVVSERPWRACRDGTNVGDLNSAPVSKRTDLSIK